MYSKNKKTLLEELFTCPICLDILKDPATTKCGHSFCLGCVKKNKYECAVCRTKIEENFIINYVVKKAIESLQNMSDEEYETRNKQRKINDDNSLKMRRNEEKMLQTECKPKRINFTTNIDCISRENYLAKSENVNKYRIKRLRSQIDCFNEIDTNYMNSLKNGFLMPENNQGQIIECNRNLFNNNSNNQVELKFLYPDNQSSSLNKLTTRVIDNYLDHVLNKFQNGNSRMTSDNYSYENYSQMREYNINFFNNKNMPTPVQNHINNVNINIYGFPPGHEYFTSNTHLHNSDTDKMNFNLYEVPGKRFKYK